jgi:cbb3-type cytochrome oxidase maturation protein
MTDFFYLIPIALALGAVGLGAFLWSLKSGQYEDLDGAAHRILFDDDDAPIVTPDPILRRNIARDDTDHGSRQ